WAWDARGRRWWAWSSILPRSIAERSSRTPCQTSLMDVLTGRVDARWGPIHLAATRHGVVALESRTIDEAFEAGLRRRGAVTIRPLDGGSDDAATVARDALGALRRYLDGARDALDDVAVDLAGCSAF